MSNGFRNYTLYCHWCNKPYESTKPIKTSRFCSARCKQAHYRAYKKYVTALGSQFAADFPRAVTQKKRKKRASQYKDEAAKFFAETREKPKKKK